MELTVLFLPTAYWREITRVLEERDLKLPEKLRLVAIGGEEASPESLKVWRRYAGTRVKLMHEYGPTETTVFATVCALSEPSEDVSRSLTPPIGRAIQNSGAYVLDDYFQPVPIGVAGELYLSGVGLARGYLNRPDATAEKFLPNPFSKAPGERLSRTGDRARYLSDGNLEFLGRVDRQVKIRGFRAEPREIETVLERRPDVHEALVLARDDDFGAKRLVAYIIPALNQTPKVDHLRDFVKERLPEYLVPSSFVFLESFPLTQNGKIDQHLLPAPAQDPPLSETGFVPPSNPVEETLDKIWAQVLGLEHVGIHDNFFDLGGHSLLATQVISRISDIFQIELPLRRLFEAPTVAGLALLVAQHQAELVSDQEVVDLLAELESLSEDDARALLVTDAQEPFLQTLR